MSHQYLLFESALGYALFKRNPSEIIGGLTQQVQSSFNDFTKFTTIVHLHSFLPFPSAEKALLENNTVADGELTDFLRNFLETNLPLSEKKLDLGVPDDKLSAAISDALKIRCVRDSATLELFRGIRQHFSKYLVKTAAGDLEKAQLGLAHSFSRSRVKFNINRVDNHIIQSLFLVDQLDKDINAFSTRIKEWYAWHFPELKQIVEDNYQFTQAVKIIQSKQSLLDTDKSAQLAELFDEITVKKIIAAAKSSMGTDISDFDLLNITHFATRVKNLSDYRTKLQGYMNQKMNDIAPNISSLLGETIGARLISQSGSLNNLAKQPASTVQILGAEKALFRALIARSNTPKHGILFNTSFISRASAKDKGRIARFLAAKTCIAARIDAYSEFDTNLYGTKLKELVEERLKFFNTGEATVHNSNSLHEVNELVKKQRKEAEKEPKKKKKEKKGKVETPKKEESKKDKKKKKEEEEEEEEEEETATPSKKKKKEKKKKEKKGKVETPSKKGKKDESESEDESEGEKEKKKKKDKKQKSPKKESKKRKSVEDDSPKKKKAKH